MIGIFTYIIIGAGVLIEYLYGYEELANLSLVICWFLVVMFFFALFAPSEKLKEISKRRTALKYITRTVFFADIAILIMCGWIITAIFLFIPWFCFNTRLESMQNNTVKAGDEVV